MAKRFIGIDINASKMHAVQLVRVGDRYRMEKTYTSPIRRGSDTPPEIFLSLTKKHGFDRRAPVAVSMPHNDIFYRNTSAAVADADGNKNDAKLPTTNEFPIPDRELVTIVCPPGDSGGSIKSSMTTATTQNSLNRRMDMLRKGRLRCELIDAPAYALYATIATNHPKIAQTTAIIIYFDGPHLILTINSKKDILIIRNIPFFQNHDDNKNNLKNDLAHRLKREMDISWRTVFANKIPENTNIVLAGSFAQNPSLVQTLKDELSCRITIADLSEKVHAHTSDKPSSDFCIAQGLALRGLVGRDTPGVNFIKADKKNKPQSRTIKKHLIVSLALMASIIGVSMIGLFVKKNRLENKYADIKNETTNIFQQAIPDEKNIVNASAQLDTHLQALRKNYNFLAPSQRADLEPLEILSIIFTNTPKKLNINIENISIHTESVHITANCKSFMDPQLWRKQLLKIPQFSSVEVKSSEKHADSGEIPFELRIALEGEKE